MWRYDDLLIVTEVINQGSFVKASAKLNIPSSTISRRVSEFESAIGVRLLERNSRKLSLTEKGQQLFNQCSPELQKIKSAVQEIQIENAQPSGKLKVTAPITLGNELLNEWFCQFAMAYPEIQLDISLSNHIEDILDESFDVAIRVGPLQDSEFIAQLLFSTNSVLCASPQYLANSKLNAESTCLQALAVAHFLSYSNHSNTLPLLNTKTHEMAELSPNTTFIATSTAILRQAAVTGLGIACLPEISIKEDIKAERLLPIYNCYLGSPRRDIYAVYPSRKHLSQKTIAFLDFLKAQAKSLF